MTTLLSAKLSLLRWKGWLIIFNILCFYFGRTLSRSILRRHRNWSSKVAPAKTTENEIQKCQVDSSNWQKHFLCVFSLSKSACFWTRVGKECKKTLFSISSSNLLSIAIKMSQQKIERYKLLCHEAMTISFLNRLSLWY